MSCIYTFKGKTYKAWEFDDILKSLPANEISKFLASENALKKSELVPQIAKSLNIPEKTAKLLVDSGLVTGVHGEAALDAMVQQYGGKYMASVGNTIEVDGVTRQATNANGKPIHYTAEGIKNFWRWYDSVQPKGLGRKVVEGSRSGGIYQADNGITGLDESGRPRVFYHGTQDSIDSFDIGHKNRKDTGWLGRGVYLTTDHILAESYANLKRGNESPNVMQLYAAIKNPFFATLELKKKLSKATQEQIDKVTENLIRAGYDGVALTFFDETHEVVVFSPEQVKSVTGNRGTFDPDDADIRKSVSVQSQGATLPDGRIVLNLDALSEDNFDGVLKHEGFHAFVRDMIGAETFDAMLSELDKRLKLARGNSWLTEAESRIPDDTPDKDRTEELAAYAIEGYANGDQQPNFIVRWVESFLSAIRTALIKSKFAPEKLRVWAMKNVQPQDLANLAASALRAKAKSLQAMEEGEGYAGREAVAYSVAENIVASIEELHDALNGDPVANLKTTDAPHKGYAAIREWAVGIFKDYGFYANNKKIGKVLMDERSVRDSLSHGRSISPFKAVAFKAVPDVIESGSIVHIERKGDMDSIYISAPVVINDTDDIVTVLVHRDVNTQRMYLHSVTTKESLLSNRVSSADTGVVSERSGSSRRGGISNILHAALTYKKEDGAKYSRAKNTPPSSVPPEETMFQKQQRLWQDKLNRFTVIKEWLSDNGVKLTEQADVYKAEERMHSRFANKAENFRENRVKPLVEKIQKAGFTMDQVAEFLHAQHAEERNIQIAKVNPKMPDGGSGMETADAKAILAKADPKLAALANEMQAITRDTKDILLASGVISKEMADAWDDTYQNYVPLKGGPDSKATKTGAGKGLSARNNQKRALGHEERETGEWIIENILADHERALMLAEKNRVFQSLLKMAVEVGDPSLMSVNKPEKRQVLKNNVSFQVRVKGVVQGSYQTLEGAKAFKIAVSSILGGSVSPSDVTIEKTSDPMVSYMSSPMPQANEATGYVNGHLVRIQLNDDLMARAYNNMGAEGLNATLKAGRALNGYFSKIYTGYNPEFIITNVIRDFTTGLANVTGEEGFKLAAKSAKNYMARFGELFKYATTGKETKWVKMYREDGGNTGAAYLSDIERLGKEVQIEYAAFKGVKENLQNGDYLNAARAAGRKLFDKTLVWIERLNQAGENAMRLAVYQAAVESGKTRTEAASLAKNSTVNFNRKGEVGQQMNAMYLFFNASVQGTAAVAHAHFKGKHKLEALGFSSTLIGLGYMLSLLAAGDDDEEYEKLSDYERARNLIIRTDEGFAKIPMAYGYGFFWNLGRGFADAQRTGEVGKIPWHIASSFVEEFTPFGAMVAGKEPSGEQALLGALPTAAQIFAAPAMNRTTFGGQLMPESKFKENQPDSEKMWRGTRGTMADELASTLSATGLEVSPETIKHFGRTFTGGAGAFSAAIYDTASLKAKGAELEAKEIPFARKFYTVPDVKGARSRYYEATSEAKKALEEFQRLKKAGDMNKAYSFQQENQELIALAKIANRKQKAIKAMRDRADAVRLEGNYTKAEERLIIKQMERREEEFYDDYVRMFKERMSESR